MSIGDYALAVAQVQLILLYVALLPRGRTVNGVSRSSAELREMRKHQSEAK